MKISSVYKALVLSGFVEITTGIMAQSGSNSYQLSLLLAEALSKKVSFPQSGAYNQSLSSYWSVQEQTIYPACIITPSSAEDVSLVVKVASEKCALVPDLRLAVRGGGHTPWAGSANIDKGITIDMRSLNKVQISKDKSIAYVGAGAVWGDVYKKMDENGLAVIGGRGAAIGVGGLSLGGGISYFSARKGFACDNIINYQVVLADGKIVDANKDSNPDLFLALKGGNNNFGIVTRFDMATFPSGDFWGGHILYTGDASPSLMQAFVNLNSNFDEYAALILSFSWVSGIGHFASANVQYTSPTTNPPAFKAFTEAQPQISNTARISNQTDFVTEFMENQGPGRRQIYVTNTFKNDLEAIKHVYAMAEAASKALPQQTGLTLNYVIQPIPTQTVRHSGKNVLGLSPEDGPLVLVLFSLTFDDPSQEATCQALMKKLNDDTVVYTKSRGLWNKWVYLNYAAQWQAPFEGYGAANKKLLQDASRKYDPKGFWQKYVPGGFKVFAKP